MGSGSGPGVITPDGCAVDLYAAFPPGDREAELIASAVIAGAELLELGSGAGRVTHSLLARGYRVVAVDESPEMLAHVEAAETVQSGIEELALDRRFDAVLLASHLVNAPDDGLVLSFLQSCARHAKPEGVVLIERHPPAWFDAAVESVDEHGGIRFELSGITRPDVDLLSATVSYTIGERTWQQHFTARRRDDADLDRLLAPVGLRRDRYLDADGSWIACRPA